MSGNTEYTDLLYAITYAGLAKTPEERNAKETKAIDIIVTMNPQMLNRVSMGNSPLLLAAKYGLVNVINALLDNGANPNVANYKGETPLMKATKHGQLDAVKVLLEKGADANKKSLLGNTALKIAQKQGNNVLVNSLSNVSNKGGGQGRKTRKQKRRKTSRRRKNKKTKKN